MFEYEDIEQQYASYAALKQNNCIGMTCLSAKQLEKYIIGVRGQKTESVYTPIKPQDLHQTLEEEDQYYNRWKQCFQQSLQEERKDPLQHSIFKAFRSDIWFGILLAQIGYLCHCMTPLLLFYIYGNLIENRVHSTENKVFVIAVILCRLFRIFGCYYGEIQQNKAVTNAILKKTIMCSPLTNKNISATDLSKMMHTDCSVLLMYPAKLSYFLENVLSFITLSGIVLFVSGLPGLIGILLIGANLFFRILFKRVINKVEKGLNERTKERVKATIQIFNIIKFIKANALQSCYFNKLRQLRISQVVELKTRLFLQIIQNIIIMISKPLIVVLVVKLLAERGQTLNLQVLFTVNLCIIIINMQAIINALAYIDIIQVSLQNIEQFMQQNEMDLSHIHFSKGTSANFAIQIEHGNFGWNSNQKKSEQPLIGDDLHLKDINLKIKKGQLVTLIGTYGSGKTSLANCLLGEMNKKGNPSIEINGSIAYASQVPWIMNDTIRNNILFGKPYNYKKYAQVIKFASLESDLLLFPNGDLQVIGKRGSTLSGGQRARVSLARALYSDADIYILDDILSAVDAHVGSFLFSMTIKRYLKSKTVLLITHSLYYVSYADRIIIFQDGEIKSQGTYEQVGNSPYLRKITASQLRTSKDYDMVLSKTLDFAQPQQVVRKAEQQQQAVSIFESFQTYIRRNSGALFAVIMIIFILVLSAVTTNTQINLNRWALSAEARNNSYLYIQLLLNGCKVVITLVLAWVLHRSRLFQSIHDDMIRSLLFSPLSYFEKVPSEKIVNRLSNDLNINDKIITTEFAFLLTNIQMFLAHLLGIFYVYIIFGNYFYLAFLILIISITLYIIETYFSLSLKINKLEQELIIPINTKYSELLDGLTVIRAFKKMQYILNNFWNKMNIFSMSSVIRHIVDGRIKFIIYSSANFLAILDILSLLFFDSTFKNYTVFVIFNYFAFEDTIMRFYQSVSAFAPRLQSLGKCEQLTVLAPQRGYIGFLRDNWKQDGVFDKIYFGNQIFPKGEIVFKSFCLRYKPDSEDVLKHLSFTIQPGEKIGIVGRTGSGKSTMMLGLLRILEASSGIIEIDGKDISKLSLEELRSNINIILQDHFMFAGTVRQNVDPTGSHTDQQIEDVLKLCGIWDQFSSKEGVNTLVAEGGDNLSSGEKQLLNISRSLLNPKRIVLIDEATASIDIETDALIQKVIKKQFADKTVLTIAHRINTVVESDRILVLNKGEIAQFDSPQRLLERQNSVFAKLYKQSGKMKEDQPTM